MEKFITKMAHRWLDRHSRAPRGLGMSIDEGLPDRGIRYGGAQTIHNTGTVDITVSEAGVITEVWFRCHLLPYRVFKGGKGVYGDVPSVLTPGIVAIEFAPESSYDYQG